MTKRKFDQFQLIYDYDTNRGPAWIYIHLDQYETAESFLQAAQDHMNKDNGWTRVEKPTRTVIRVNPADPDTQIDLGLKFFIDDLGEGAEPRPGRFPAWKADLVEVEEPLA